MARINLDMEFFSDNRFEYLAGLLGEHPWMSRYRIILLWRGLYLKREAEVTFQELALMTTWTGAIETLVDALLKSNLAWQSDDEKLTIKGIDKRICYLVSQAEKGRKGGSKKHSRSQAVAKPEDSRSQAVAKHMLSTSQAVATNCSSQKLAGARKTSSLPLALSPALAPSPDPALAPDLEENTTPPPPLQGGAVISPKPKAEGGREVVLAPEGVGEQVWRDFVAARKQMKCPVTQTALDGICREAAKAGWSVEAALRECAIRGWRGFKAEWVSGQKRPQEKPTGPIDWTNGGKL